MSFNKLKNILNSKGHDNLENLLQRAKDIEILNKFLIKNLDDDMSSHIVSCSLNKNGNLTVFCDSSAWLAKLRYKKNSILEIVRKKYPHAASCEIKITGNKAKK